MRTAVEYYGLPMGMLDKEMIRGIYHHGSLFYPGYVAGAVAPVMERCVITSYGIRKKFRSLMRTWDIYPDLLQVKSCQPVDENAPVLQNRDYR